VHPLDLPLSMLISSTDDHEFEPMTMKLVFVASLEIQDKTAGCLSESRPKKNQRIK
jgi:hypothetical protein